jgi:hypothetical protein
MQSYPADIWQTILAELSYCYPDPKELGRKRGLSGFLACALTCRAVSDIARPHIFKTVVIYSAHRGRTLLALLNGQPCTASWIREVCIRSSKSVEVPSPNTNALMEFIASSDGLSLMSFLTNARQLRVSEFHYSMQTILYPYTVTAAWNTLRTLRTITVLDLGSLCELPSLQAALDLFTEAYPNLQALLLGNLCFQLPLFIQWDKDHTLRLTVRSVATRLRKLSFRTGQCDHDLDEVLRVMDFGSLTHLEVAAVDCNRIYRHPSLSYIQFMLDHAPQLQELTLLPLTQCYHGSSTESPEISLASNDRLERIIFEGVTNNPSIDPSWYARMLKTLPHISQLRYLRISGDLKSMDNHTWSLFDNVLSNPELGAEPGYRILVLEHIQEYFVGARFKTMSSADHFSRGLLPKTQSRGAFVIDWIVEDEQPEWDGTIKRTGGTELDIQKFLMEERDRNRTAAAR